MIMMIMVSIDTLNFMLKCRPILIFPNDFTISIIKTLPQRWRNVPAHLKLHADRSSAPPWELHPRGAPAGGGQVLRASRWLASHHHWVPRWHLVTMVTIFTPIPQNLCHIWRGCAHWLPPGPAPPQMGFRALPTQTMFPPRPQGKARWEFQNTTHMHAHIDICFDIIQFFGKIFVLNSTFRPGLGRWLLWTSPLRWGRGSWSLGRGTPWRSCSRRSPPPCRTPGTPWPGTPPANMWSGQDIILTIVKRIVKKQTECSLFYPSFARQNSILSPSPSSECQTRQGVCYDDRT